MQARLQPLDHMGDSSGSSGRLHISPHGAHVDKVEAKVGQDFVDYEDDEHEYEALPSGYGWGVNMAAGAMVSIAGSVSRLGSALDQRQLANFVCCALLTFFQAGISEHAAIFPVDSIKVS